MIANLISCNYTKYTPWEYHILESEQFELHHKVQNKNVSPLFDVIWRNIYISLVIAMSKPIVIFFKHYLQLYFSLSYIIHVHVIHELQQIIAVKIVMATSRELEQ